MPIENSIGDRRWTIFLWVYTALTFLPFVNSYVLDVMKGGSPLSHVTSILLGFTWVILLFMFFKPTRRFALKYLILPYFGLSCSVFCVRLLFEVFSGVDWFSSVLTLNYGKYTTFFLHLARFVDVIEHFLPLLIAYQIMHVFREYLRELFLELRRPARILLGFSPTIIICSWYITHDQYATYMLPHTYVVTFGGYAIPFLISIYVTFLFHVINYPLQGLRAKMAMVRILAIVGIGAHLVIGVYLYGFSNLWVNGLSWAALLLMGMTIAMYRKKISLAVTGNLLLPVYGVVMIMYMMREFLFTAEGGKHTVFLSKINPGVYEPMLLYTIYLFLSYVAIGPLIAEILMIEMPYDLREKTPYKDYLRRYDSVIQDIWQSYGAFIITVFYVSINAPEIRSMDPSLGNSANLIVLGFAFVCSFVFCHLHYLRNIKRA